MPGFAAIAHSRIKRHVISDGPNLLQRSCPVPDQSCPFDRCAHFAVHHAVGFGTGKHELAIGDVHLTAAKANGVNAVLQVRDDVTGCHVTAQHIGVGHARHRRVGIAFASPVAGGRDPHQARVLAVLHVADQYTVFDQGIFGRWRAFVIHGDRPAPIRDRAIIQHGHTTCCDLLAHQAGKRRTALAVEISLKPVPDRFVQQNAGPPGAKHDVHHAGRGRDGIEVHDGHA